MKVSLIVGYMFVFALSVLAGFWLGHQPIPQLNQVVQTEVVLPLPYTTDTGQISLILVNVKQLTTKRPELQVIWMVAFNSDTPIKLIPIYPSYNQDPTNDIELSQTFGLLKTRKGYELDKTTIRKLEARGFVWDGSVVLDNRALAYFIDAFGFIKVGEDTLDRDQLASFNFPLSQTNQLSLTFNTLLWREVCWNILHSPEDINNLNSNFKKHASINFSEPISGLDWITLLSNVKIPSCEFPMYFQNNP